MLVNLDLYHNTCLYRLSVSCGWFKSPLLDGVHDRGHSEGIRRVVGTDLVDYSWSFVWRCGLRATRTITEL
jgi:hypothetical protein